MPTEDETRSSPPADAPARGDACLVFVEGEPVLGLRVPLADEVVLGRDPDCAVPLFADDVSRRHARISHGREGHTLVDLDSTNGTWVNDRRVRVHRLQAGDRVRLGRFVARYVAADDPEGRQLVDIALASRRDPLTALPNRRAFEEDLAREWARAARAGAPLAVVILDVDRFKAVNDAYGHAAGDEVLRVVGTRAAGAIRAGDLLARIGGEEFGIILPATELSSAVDVAERVRATLAALPVEAAGFALAVTASLGCAALAKGERGDALVARADARLYAAKAAGRNRVEF